MKKKKKLVINSLGMLGHGYMKYLGGWCKIVGRAWSSAKFPLCVTCWAGAGAQIRSGSVAGCREQDRHAASLLRYC